MWRAYSNNSEYGEFTQRMLLELEKEELAHDLKLMKKQNNQFSFHFVERELVIEKRTAEQIQDKNVKKEEFAKRINWLKEKLIKYNLVKRKWVFEIRTAEQSQDTNIKKEEAEVKDRNVKKEVTSIYPDLTEEMKKESDVDVDLEEIDIIKTDLMLAKEKIFSLEAAHREIDLKLLDTKNENELFKDTNKMLTEDNGNLKKELQDKCEQINIKDGLIASAEIELVKKSRENDRLKEYLNKMRVEMVNLKQSKKKVNEPTNGGKIKEVEEKNKDLHERVKKDIKHLGGK